MAARKRSHYHIWAHINPVVHRVPRRVSINRQHTTKIVHDSTDMSHVTSVHKYNVIHQSTIKSYYKPCSNKIVVEAIKFENQHLTSLFQYSASPWSQPQKHDRGN